MISTEFVTMTANGKGLERCKVMLLILRFYNLVPFVEKLEIAAGYIQALKRASRIQQERSDGISLVTSTYH
jgi:hypothetical protein